MTLSKQVKAYFIILFIVSIYVINKFIFSEWNKSPFFWATLTGWFGMMAVLYPAIRHSMNNKMGNFERILIALGVLLSISSLIILAFLTLKAIMNT